jgi:hypothetical protein
MQAQDYFSLEHLESQVPLTASAMYAPKLTLRSDSVSPIASRRILLQLPSLDADASPICREVSFSSWTRYTTSPISTPAGQLKASLLCKASGMSPSNNPPADEWFYLGADQPLPTGKPANMQQFRWRQRKSPGQSSMSTCSSFTSIEEEGQITFTRQPVKRMSTESQLSQSMKTASCSAKDIGVSAAKKYGLEGLTCEELPSAFDDSDEDEEQDGC